MSLHQHEDGTLHMPGRIHTALVGKRIQIDSYLGQLRISVEIPRRAAKVNVHLSAARDFEHDSETLIASMYAPGVLFASAPYDEPSYVRFVPVDRDGVQMSTTTVRVQPTRPVFCSRTDAS